MGIRVIKEKIKGKEIRKLGNELLKAVKKALSKKEDIRKKISFKLEVNS